MCIRDRSPSILPNTSPTQIISLKDAIVISGLEERAPTLYRCLLTAVSSKRKAGVQKKNTTAALRGQFNKEITLVVFTCVIYTCKVRLVNTRIQ